MDSQQSLPENVKNTVRYELHLSKLPDEAIVEGYRERLKPIWSREQMGGDFGLEIDEKQNKCHGSFDVNQKIEREWLIIYALYDLSKFDKDLVATVQDNDGEILLITAAEAIPQWLESSKSKNRVFIHRGSLHIIPEEIDLKDLLQRSAHCSTITQAAACFVRDMNTSSSRVGGDDCMTPGGKKIKTLADRPIQAAIEEQLSGMPDQRAWLSKKFKQLDDILSGGEGMDDTEELQKKFEGDISLASVMAMDDEDLMVSPISSRSASTYERSSASSSSSWLTEQEDD